MEFRITKYLPKKCLVDYNIITFKENILHSSQSPTEIPYTINENGDVILTSYRFSGSSVSMEIDLPNGDYFNVQLFSWSLTGELTDELEACDIFSCGSVINRHHHGYMMFADGTAMCDFVTDQIYNSFLINKLNNFIYE